MIFNHKNYMHRALELATRGKGAVNPNPCVGCVIVNRNRIVAEGYHKKFGGPHAEVIALNKAKGKARNATVYLTLEPCTHWGKTPPCAPQLIQSGIKKAFISIKDPNPNVNGKGVSTLRKAGIKVHLGLEKEAASFLLRPYITSMTKKRPYVIVKTAMTLDGKIASFIGDSKWISSPESRRVAHKLRAESDAVLVGDQTAKIDNPSLTSHKMGKNPLRVILDPFLSAGLNLKVYKDKAAPTILITSTSISAQLKLALETKKIPFHQMKHTSGRFNMRDVMAYLSKLDVCQLFVEGGGETIWSFVQSQFVDEIWVFIAPLLLGGRDSKTPVEGIGFKKISDALRIKRMHVTRIGEDILLKGIL